MAAAFDFVDSLVLSALLDVEAILDYLNNEGSPMASGAVILIAPATARVARHFLALHPIVYLALSTACEARAVLVVLAVRAYLVPAESYAFLQAQDRLFQ